LDIQLIDLVAVALSSEGSKFLLKLLDLGLDLRPLRGRDSDGLPMNYFNTKNIEF
jgi:hypothetical protein